MDKQLDRTHYVGQYCKQKDWDVSQLTLEQIKEIRAEFLKTHKVDSSPRPDPKDVGRI